MNKLMSLVGIVLVLVSCKNPGKQNTTEQQTVAEEITVALDRDNYAVVWEWSTRDLELVKDNTGFFTTELIELWTNKDIENVYFNKDAGLDTSMPFPTISFFIKAESTKDAKVLLDNLTIVTKDIASYKLHPVGMLWLGQKQGISDINSQNNSFVCIWETMNKRPVDEQAKAQNDAVLALWNQGTIENAYFDIEGVAETNEKTDFVFYVNAASINEADSICKSLPFFKESLASFKIYPAGTFWLGVYDENTK